MSSIYHTFSDCIFINLTYKHYWSLLNLTRFCWYKINDVFKRVQQRGTIIKRMCKTDHINHEYLFKLDSLNVGII